MGNPRVFQRRQQILRFLLPLYLGMTMFVYNSSHSCANLPSHYLRGNTVKGGVNVCGMKKKNRAMGTPMHFHQIL